MAFDTAPLLRELDKLDSKLQDHINTEQAREDRFFERLEGKFDQVRDNITKLQTQLEVLTAGALAHRNENSKQMEDVNKRLADLEKKFKYLMYVVGAIAAAVGANDIPAKEWLSLLF
jgi:chromosome segregation ATPase